MTTTSPALHPTPTSTPRSRTARPRSAPPLRSAPPADPALDEALERISELAARLWAIRSAHRPVTVGWRRETRCADCGQAVPCATLRAAG